MRIQKAIDPNWVEESKAPWRLEAQNHFENYPGAKRYWGRGVSKEEKARYEVVAHIIGLFRGTFEIRVSYTPQEIVQMIREDDARCADCRNYKDEKSQMAQAEMEDYAIDYFTKLSTEEGE